MKLFVFVCFLKHELALGKFNQLWCKFKLFTSWNSPFSHFALKFRPILTNDFNCSNSDNLRKPNPSFEGFSVTVKDILNTAMLHICFMKCLRSVYSKVVCLAIEILKMKIPKPFIAYLLLSVHLLFPEYNWAIWQSFFAS